MSGIYAEEIDLAEQYEKYLCRVVLILGHMAPKDTCDGCIRDLIADVYDSLVLAKMAILQAHGPLAFPLLRRGFEGVCMIHYFVLKPSKSARWESGQEITNSQVRAFLGQHAMGESGDALKANYAFLSGGSHVNRDYVPHRFLGEGNAFILGSIGHPDIFASTDWLMRLLSLWFWVGATVTLRYGGELGRADPSLLGDYLELGNRVKPTLRSMEETLTKLQSEMTKP